jgi:integrase
MGLRPPARPDLREPITRPCRTCTTSSSRSGPSSASASTVTGAEVMPACSRAAEAECECEVLGLRWSDVNLDAGTLWVRRGRLRPRYEHGCDGQCGRSPGYCAQRRQVRSETDETKSRAGRRAVGLPDELAELIKRHREEQEAERAAAAQLWRDGGYVFATPTGEPINPSTDYHQWKRLLAEAGLRDGRLHDARHTAATVLLILGVPERAVMGLMGWSTTAMAARYQHITGTVRDDVARRVGGLIWGPAATD